MRLKLKALLSTIALYLLFFIVYYLLNYVTQKLWAESEEYYLIIILSFINGLLIILFLLIFSMFISSYKNIFSTFYDFFKIKSIDYDQFSFDDLRLIVKMYDNTNIFFDNKSFTVLSSSILFVMAVILFYFLSAFLFELLFKKLSYVLILFVWTIFFIIYFYINYYKFYNIDSRELYIYVFLINLYVIALLADRDVFVNLISLYQPYKNSLKNIEIQNLLYNYIRKYSNYLVDWTLIQGVILPILIYKEFGKKRQIKYEEKNNMKREEFNAIYSLIDITEEIINDLDFYGYYLIISSDINKCRVYKNKIYKNKLLDYNQKISDLFPKIYNSDFACILDIYSLNLLNDKNFINMFIEQIEKPSLKICFSCKHSFFGMTEDILCEDCRKHSLIIYK